MNKNMSLLKEVTLGAKGLVEKREQLAVEAQAWVNKQMVKAEREFDQTVVTALEDGHSVMSIARALTISGKTPNRNRVYEIRGKYTEGSAPWVGDYPFEWVPRTVKTAKGTQEVFDVRAVLSDFGPNGITGTFTWRYDVASGETEQVVDPVDDPYPEDIKYYRQMLSRWLSINPYPGGE